jgi:hypothetical protein
MVCDPTTKVCRNPNQFDPCLPGGPSCNLIGDTNAASWVCVNPAPTNPQSSNQCWEACKNNGDCVLPFMSCDAIGIDHLCFYQYNSTCTPFSTCNGTGTNDGICYTIAPGGTNTPYQSCYQARTDGDGGPGTACNVNATRQNPGGFCDTSDICLAGICQPICDVTGAGGRTCSGANGLCLQDPAFGDQTGTTTPVTVLGACGVTCDFTDLGGSNCVTSDAGVASKCFPGVFGQFGYPDDGTGFCVAASTTPIALGQSCSSDGVHFDPCVAGTACIGSAAAGSTCTQLCTNVGLACTDGGTCLQINNGAGGAYAHVGYCG